MSPPRHIDGEPLIDASGTIQHIWATVKPAGHAAAVLAAVQAKAGTPPAG